MRTDTPTIDDQFGADVAARLRAEVSTVRAGSTLMPALRRRQAQRTWALRAAAVTPLAAATAFAVMLGAANGTTGPGGAPPLAAPTGASALPDLELVAARTSAALDTLADKIVVTHTASGQGRRDTFRDPVTGHSRGDTYDGDRLVSSDWRSGPLTDENAVVTYVDYASRTWFTQPLYQPSDKGHIPTRVQDYTDPATIRAALADGALTLVGSEQLDGHATLHLYVTRIAQLGREEGVELSFDLWVDAASYLPYRHRINKGGHVADVTLTWLARTPENLAKVELVPPAGFTEVDPSAGSGAVEQPDGSGVG